MLEIWRDVKGNWRWRRSKIHSRGRNGDTGNDVMSQRRENALHSVGVDISVATSDSRQQC